VDADGKRIKLEPKPDYLSATVSKSGAKWIILEDFCGTSGGRKHCGESFIGFELEKGKLLLLDPQGNRRAVTVIEATATHLAISFPEPNGSGVLDLRLSTPSVWVESYIQHTGDHARIGITSFRRVR
jgi:hypothetical protein